MDWRSSGESLGTRGYGAVGARIVGHLRSGGDVAIAAGRDPARADRVVNLADAGTVRAALSDVDVVVNAAGVEDPAVAALITGYGAALVDITASTGYVAALERLGPPRPVLLSVGLTNLLAAAVHAAAPGPVDLAVFLGAGERHGAAAVAWSYGLSNPRADRRLFAHRRRFTRVTERSGTRAGHRETLPDRGA